ncbi:caspase family protein [Aquincola sp. S2]|uniref:Caspase family protein n=1 Tax=Pseudaquabacterium terrae TaxID=2732868 RepID=A0ABX2ENF5_9BURK|nr:caspase family protein [Aquabacterium terrae]NRF70171.1 caspase family protein [Aquabacterium terrae]
MSQRRLRSRAVAAAAAAALALLPALGGPAASTSQERLALVIGNANYPGNELLNPKNDARAVAELLQRAGFQVDARYDASRADMVSAMQRFGARMRDSQVRFAVFYYAGHGLQQDWRNYLVPVDAKVKTAPDVQRQTVDVSELMRHMSEARGRSYLLILDACREDPFVGAWRPPAKGLSPFDAPAGSLLAYATAPGQLAYDGRGSNGLYTKHLVRELATPDTSLEDAFKRVRLNVRMESEGRQVPWESTSLEQDVMLFPQRKGTLSVTELEQRFEKEMSDWQRVRNSSNVAQLTEFIRAYPSGNASELAQARLNRLLEDELRKNETARREEARRKAAEAEAERLKAETALRERLAAAEREAQRVAAEREAARIAAEREATRIAADREAARKEAERAEAARIAAERADAARIAAAESAARQRAAEEAELRRRQEAEARQRERERQEAVRVAEQRAAEVESRRKQAEAQERQAAETRAREADAARRELQRLADAADKQRIVAAQPALAVVAQLAPTPFFQGRQQHRRDYRVGDHFEFRIVDQFSRSEKPLSLHVTAVDENVDRVEYNGGEYASDMMGNTTANPLGSMGTPRQFYPAELVVGHRWRTMFKQSRARVAGLQYTFQYDVKVAAKETIQVPAGRYEAYRIEARGFNVDLGAAITRTIWIAPGVNADIAHETMVRLRDGRVEQHDRQELVSLARR